jgi:hypothetical protein
MDPTVSIIAFNGIITPNVPGADVFLISKWTTWRIWLIG